MAKTRKKATLTRRHSPVSIAAIAKRLGLNHYDRVLLTKAFQTSSPPHIDDLKKIHDVSKLITDNVTAAIAIMEGKTTSFPIKNDDWVLNWRWLKSSCSLTDLQYQRLIVTFDINQLYKLEGLEVKKVIKGLEQIRELLKVVLRA